MDIAAFKALQAEMPWTEIWSEGFTLDPRSYSRFQHCLINISAKLGAILQRVELADHYGPGYKLALDRDKDATALAIIIMSALKAANVYPDGPLPLAEYIQADLKRRGA